MNPYNNFSYMFPCAFMQNPYCMNKNSPTNTNNNYTSMYQEEEIYSDFHEITNAINLIREALVDEEKDKLFYESIIKLNISIEDREIIKGIIDDKVEHFRILKQLYYELTSQILMGVDEVDICKYKDYQDALGKLIVNKQKGIKIYGKIMFALKNMGHKENIFEILIDELRHGILLGYLCTKRGHK